MKNNIKKWKEFSYSDFFSEVTGNVKLSNRDLSDSGVIPVYSSSTINNGIFGYTDKTPSYVVTKENPKYLIFGDHTKSMFIANESFSIMDNVKVLLPKINNEYCIRFITTVWRKAIPSLGYSRHWSTAKHTPILLPVNNVGEVDYEYMENYIKKVEINARKKFSMLNCENLYKIIDTSEWKEFKIGELFDIISPNVYHTREVREDENGIPYVVRSKYNNGMKYRVKLTENLILNPKNVISFGAENASFFYQEDEYVSGRDMYYIDTRKISKNASLFLISCLGTLTSKYSYNFGLFPKLLKEEIIKLPSKTDGTPDYLYMEKYMEKIKNDIFIKINRLNAL